MPSTYDPPDQPTSRAGRSDQDNITQTSLGTVAIYVPIEVHEKLNHLAQFASYEPSTLLQLLITSAWATFKTAHRQIQPDQWPNSDE